MVVPTPDGVRNPLVLAAAHLAGVTRVVHDRRRAGDRGARLRHADDPRRRQDLRPGQRLRRRGQAPRVRRRRHRHDRRRLRDPGDRRRASANPDWVAIDLFSQAEHDELAQAMLRHARRSACSTRSRARRSALVRADAARADHRGVVRQPRRADQGARSRRGVRGRNRVAPEHLELAVAESRRAAADDPPCRRDLHRSPRVRGARRLLRRTEPRAADRPHGALLVAARRLRFPEALERAAHLARRRAHARRRRRRRSRTARA